MQTLDTRHASGRKQDIKDGFNWPILPHISKKYLDILAANPGLSEDELAEIQEQKKKLKRKKDEILAEGYKDLHTVVMKFFSKKNKSDSGVPLGLLGMVFYVISMAVLGFHLWHGFASAFQSMGLNHPKYTPLIKIFGRGYAVVVPLLFAIIPILIYLNS